MATAVLFALVAVLAVGQFLLFGALAEAYRDIRQLREFSDMIDRHAPVDLKGARGQAPSTIGLDPALDDTVRAVVVYLDSRCRTCQSIVNSLDGTIPDTVWLVIVSDSTEAAYTWLGGGGIREGDPSARRVMVASDDETERNLGFLLTPLAIEIEHGLMARAKSIPSVRQFYNLAAGPITLTGTPAQPYPKGVAS